MNLSLKIFIIISLSNLNPFQNTLFVINLINQKLYLQHSIEI